MADLSIDNLYTYVRSQFSYDGKWDLCMTISSIKLVAIYPGVGRQRSARCRLEGASPLFLHKRQAARQLRFPSVLWLPFYFL